MPSKTPSKGKKAPAAAAKESVAKKPRPVAAKPAAKAKPAASVKTKPVAKAPAVRDLDDDDELTPALDDDEDLPGFEDEPELAAGVPDDDDGDVADDDDDDDDGDDDGEKKPAAKGKVAAPAAKKPAPALIKKDLLEPSAVVPARRLTPEAKARVNEMVKKGMPLGQALKAAASWETFVAPVREEPAKLVGKAFEGGPRRPRPQQTDDEPAAPNNFDDEEPISTSSDDD